MTAVSAPLRRLAVIATRGTSNNLFQVATLVRAATALGTVVDVLFQDAALEKLERARINQQDWSSAYAAVQSDLVERLHAADFRDLESFLLDAKEHGDDVHFWASSDSMSELGLHAADLSPLIDGQRERSEFDVTAGASDALLVF